MKGGTPNSLATSNASVPKRSTTRAERGLVVFNELRRVRRAGRERSTVREMRVSILASEGTSSS